MPKPIKIIKGEPHITDKDREEVSKGKLERIEWSSEAGDWLVVFDHPSPFERHYFSPSHPGNTDIVVEPGEREYKYTVYVEGKRGKDPIIIVTP